MNDDIAFTFPIDGTITCKICKQEFNILVWSDALRSSFCDPCFDKWYDKIMEYRNELLHSDKY